MNENDISWYCEQVQRRPACQLQYVFYGFGASHFDFHFHLWPGDSRWVVTKRYCLPRRFASTEIHPWGIVSNPSVGLEKVRLVVKCWNWIFSNSNSEVCKSVRASITSWSVTLTSKRLKDESNVGASASRLVNTAMGGVMEATASQLIKERLKLIKN